MSTKQATAVASSTHFRIRLTGSSLTALRVSHRQDASDTGVRAGIRKISADLGHLFSGSLMPVEAGLSLLGGRFTAGPLREREWPAATIAGAQLER